MENKNNSESTAPLNSSPEMNKIQEAGVPGPPKNIISSNNVVDEASVVSAKMLNNEPMKNQGIITGGVEPTDTVAIAKLSTARKPKFKLALPNLFSSQYTLASKLFFGLGSLIMLLIVGGLIFYMSYWTRQGVVYSRFQKNLASVLTKTVNSEVELFNDLKFEAELSSESQDFNFKLNSSGRLYDSGFETNNDIKYDEAAINLGVITLNNDSNFELFFKYKGIEQFYKSLLKSSTTGQVASDFSPVVNVLKKYEDKWINVNLFDFLSGDSNNDEETITKDDYKIAINAILPIINNRFVGLDDKNAVLKRSNVRSEDVAGRPAFAYDLEIDNKKFNEMIDELIKSINASKLSDRKKEVINNQLEDQKMLESDDNSTSTYKSKFSSTQKYTIWLNKLTGLPVKYSAISSSSYDGKKDYETETTFEISKFSISKIEAKIISTNKNYNYVGKESKNEFTGNLVVDTKSSLITFSGGYKPDGDESSGKFSYKVTLQKNDNKAAIEAPKSSASITTLYDELISTFESATE